MTKGTVLIVDDEADIRTLISITLTSAGYEVIEAEDGEQALEALDSGQTIDLILCDVYMPNVNGLEAVTLFRSSYQSIPVIVMTGKPDAQYAKRLFEQGVSVYLVKPLEQKTLLAAVQKALQGKPNA